MILRLTMTVLLLAALCSAAWVLWYEPDATPAAGVERWIDTCRATGSTSSKGEPHATLRSDTRVAITATAPWRCEIPLKPGPDLTLAFGIGVLNAPVPLSLHFEDASGSRQTIYRAPRSQPGSTWIDEKLDLGSLPARQGRLVFDVGGEGLEFHLAEPVAYRRSERPEANLVLILLDTLRGDHVGFAGYDRPTTPVLDRLAAQGTVFSRAYSPSSWTRPSTAALLTGLEPYENGVHHDRSRIPADMNTIASALREAGYATSGLSRNPNVLPIYGFDRGFERFVDADSADWGRATDVGSAIDAALGDLERIRDRPFFLYLHLNQIHAPYAPPEEHRRAVAGGRDHPLDLYDGEIRFTDEQIGRLWDRIESLGLDDRTLLAVVSDHGEEFGEHGAGSHGLTLYEEVLRIPLFVRWPGRVSGGGRIERPVRLSALAPTLLDLLDVEQRLSGRPSLLDGKAASAAERLRPLYSSLEIPARRVHAVYDGRWKYISAHRPAPYERLYDLENDPGERENLLAARPGEADRLAGMLNCHLAPRFPGLRVRVVSQASAQVDLRLRTNGRVVRMWQDGLEPSDRAEVQEEGRVVQLGSKLAARDGFVSGVPRPGDKEPPAVAERQPDVDEIGLLLEPDDSVVEIEALADGSSAGPPSVWMGRLKSSPRARFGAARPDLYLRAVPAPGPDETGPAVWLYRLDRGCDVQARVTDRDAELSEPVPDELRERLRALGYVE